MAAYCFIGISLCYEETKPNEDSSGPPKALSDIAKLLLFFHERADSRRCQDLSREPALRRIWEAVPNEQ